MDIPKSDFMADATCIDKRDAERVREKRAGVIYLRMLRSAKPSSVGDDKKPAVVTVAPILWREPGLPAFLEMATIPPRCGASLTSVSDWQEADCSAVSRLF